MTLLIFTSYSPKSGAVCEDLLAATQNIPNSDSHVDGFSFTLEPSETTNTSQVQDVHGQPSEAISPTDSRGRSVTSLPSSFSCTSFGEIKEHRTFNTFDDSQDRSIQTDDLSRKRPPLLTIGICLSSRRSPPRTAPA